MRPPFTARPASTILKSLESISINIVGMTLIWRSDWECVDSGRQVRFRQIASSINRHGAGLGKFLDCEENWNRLFFSCREFIVSLANNASQVWWTPVNVHQNSFDLKYCAAAPQTCLLCPISVLKLFPWVLLSYTVSKAYVCHWQSETRKNERTMNHIYLKRLKTTLRKGVCGKLRSRVSAKIHSNLGVLSGIEEINFIFAIFTFFGYNFFSLNWPYFY